MVEADVGDVLAAVIIDTQSTTLVQGGHMRHGFDEVLRALTKLALCPLTGTREGCIPSTGGCLGQEEEGHTDNRGSHGELCCSWTGLTWELIRICCK